jgi:DNA-binding PadR family transcriptional regulator
MEGGTFERMDDDFYIMALVAAEPAHPYRVLDHMNLLGLKMARSTVYRRVDALVEAGLLSSEPAVSRRSQVRRQLALTDAGLAVLTRQAERVLTEEPLESPMFSLALHCAEELEALDVEALLRSRMAGTARQLTVEERTLRERSDTESASWQQIGRERRVAHLQADLGWLQSIVRRGWRSEGRGLKAAG